MTQPKPFTCRGIRRKKQWAIISAIALIVSMFGGQGPGPVVHAQGGAAAVGFVLDAGDIRFIFRQIQIAEAHAAGGQLLGSGPNQVPEARLPFGLRTVDGSFNHLAAGQELFGASDQVFPRLTTRAFRAAEQGTSYANDGDVADSQPRIISNLIADQTDRNPAARAVAGPDAVADPLGTLPITNVAPDVGLSAPFNSMFTFFGQFFDHGLDLVNKGSRGTVFVPLQEDDPLFVAGSRTNFMLLTRATNARGPDGIFGTADDIQGEANNQTTPFVDQNQTYTSHPSHQVFLREYALTADGPVSTGRMIDGGGEINGVPVKNIGNWAEVKAQAAALLGIALEDSDIFNIPLIAADPYGRFLRGPNGFPMMMMADGTAVEGDPAAPISTAGARKIDHAFLDDIAHNAVPRPGLNPDADLEPNPIGAPRPAGTYDDELLDAHVLTGDGRGNENIALTAVHTIFHLEHNRLRDNIHQLINTPGFLTAAEVAAWHAQSPQPPAGSGWDYGERLFQAARFVTEMQYQHLVFEEFARKLVPNIDPFIGDGINMKSLENPAIPAEFAHQTYRLGHSMLTETIARTNPDGSLNDISLLDGFLNPLEFNNGGPAGPLTAAQAAGAIFQGGTRQVGQEIDEFVTEAVRNNLLGLPLDLAVFNLARGRSEGVAPLNSVRRDLWLQTADPQLTPYATWADFGFSIKHGESLTNYIAAYGIHPTLQGATTVAGKRAAAAVLVDDPTFMFADGALTGVENIDLWIGGLAERIAPFGAMLGTTFNYIFEHTLENLQNEDRFYYLERLDGLNLISQLEGNSFAELISRNTTLSGPGADVFSRPDLVLNLTTLLQTPGVITDDPTTPEIESAMPDLVLQPNGTLRYTGPLHVIWNGRAVADRMISSEGDDTMRGDAGNDVMEGGAGNDNHIGGAGDDLLTDTFGDDVMKGGPGHDAIFGGSGPFDLLQGNEGNDFIVGGPDATEAFGGPGNDIIYMGAGLSESIGGSGDDWMEGTNSPASIAIGDDNNQFQDDPNGGSDIMLAGPGDMDFDAEGGDDIMVGNVVPTHRFEGMLGYDWVTYRGETIPVDADMLVTGLFLVLPNVNELRDRFDLTEGLSGTNFNDLLRGDHRGPAELAIGAFGAVPDGNVLTNTGINRITGLRALLPAGATEFRGGNIILGGPGSDLIEGRGGNDILDGDRWLNVQLRINGTTRRFNSLHQIKNEVAAGLVTPAAFVFERSIVTDPPLPADCGAAAPRNCDTAVFSGLRAEYLISSNADGSLTVQDTVALRPRVGVAPPGGGNNNDGTDTLRNIERLQFADVVITAPAAGPGTPVPNVVGRTQLAAQTAITDAGLIVGGITRANNPAVACNIVIDQSPLADTPVPANSAVSFTLSLGPAVPDVHDMTVADATVDILAAGLTVGTITEVFSDRAVGHIATAGQDPLPGTPCVAPGSAVNLFVSKGLAPVGTPVNGLVLSLSFDTDTLVTDAKGTTANDASGLGNHGTVEGAVAVASSRGGALQFDGVDDSVAVTGAPTLNLTNGMTIEAWVNPSVAGGLDGWESIVMKEGVEARVCCSNLQTYALYAHDAAAGPAGYIRSGQGIHATPAITPGEWTHLATTYDGVNLQLYVNGVLAATSPDAGTVDVGDGLLRIGGNNVYPGEFFAGLIDEVKVYNRALSPDEIRAEAGVAPPAPVEGLVLSLSFNTGTVVAGGTIANDASGFGNSGTVEGAVAVAAGKGGALRFDGVDDSVAVASAPSLDLTTGMTIEAWVKPAVVDSWETVVMKEGVEAAVCCSNLQSYALYAHDAAAGPVGYIRSGPGVQAAPALTPGVWTHLATTYDGVNQRLYVNGVLVATSPNGGTIDVGSGPLRIGGNNVYSGEFFQGLIDEVKVYNRALDPAEIAAEMKTSIP